MRRMIALLALLLAAPVAAQSTREQTRYWFEHADGTFWSRSERWVPAGGDAPKRCVLQELSTGLTWDGMIYLHGTAPPLRVDTIQTDDAVYVVTGTDFTIETVAVPPPPLPDTTTAPPAAQGRLELVPTISGTRYTIEVYAFDMAGAPLAGLPVDLRITAGYLGPDNAHLCDGPCTLPRTTSVIGRTEARWTVGTAGDTLEVSAQGFDALTLVSDTVPTPVPPPPAPPAPPPPTDSSDITMPQLRRLLGPTIARGTAVPGWPSHYDQNLDAAIDRMVAEVAAGSYSFITDAADQDNPHYGPLELVASRNIRAGLPLDESEPGFAAGLKVTREFVRLYAKPNGYDLQAHRNTNWSDCEIVIALYDGQASDNGVLASECRQYLTVAAQWLTAHFMTATANLSHHWMDERIIAIGIDLALVADRLGLPTGGQMQGATSWAAYVTDVLLPFTVAAQDETCRRWCGQTDPQGHPIVRGNIRYGQNSGLQCSSQPCGYAEPHSILFFEDAMLANALLRATAQIGCTGCQTAAIEMTVGVREHYDATRQALPYRSHGAGMWTSAHDLNAFWVRPLLIAYQETGETWMRDIAVGLLDGTRQGAWTWRMKQAQELGAATEPQSAEALLAGVRWR